MSICHCWLACWLMRFFRGLVVNVREESHRDLARSSCHRLVLRDGVLRESAAKLVVSILVASKRRAARNFSRELVIDAMDLPGGESHLLAVKRSLGDEVIQKGAAVAVCIRIARDESGDSERLR